MSFQTFLYILVLSCVVAVNCADPEVEIPQGVLRGSTATNRDGGTYYSFKSIPFGKAPTGERRFKNSELADGWEGTLDATVTPPKCPQGSGPNSNSASGQEDCLYLNIFTPELPSEGTVLKPTMVFIYGGGFEGGAAIDGAGFLLTKDVVLVSIQYRVGIFGFLSLDDPNLGATGNAGLKDQVLGLQWVQQNIKYFGGDPDNVLIFGQSAGSMSVSLQLLSPMSAGLYHKAISQSGVAVSRTTSPAMRNNAVAFAEYFGIQTDNLEEMLLALQSLSIDELYAAQVDLINQYEYIIRPIAEVESVEPVFMPENPIDIVKAGTFNQVPYLLGFNNIEESGTRATTDFSQFIPGEFLIEAGSEAEADISARFIEVYGTEDEGAVLLNTDFKFGFPAYRTAWEQVKNAVYPIYFYYFTAQTGLNESGGMGGGSSLAGASHGDELNYLFSGGRGVSNIEEGSVEDLAIKNMVALWTNFAIYSNPTPEGFDYTWESVQEGAVNYLHIDSEEWTSETDLNPERMQLWQGLYADYFPETRVSKIKNRK